MIDKQLLEILVCPEDRSRVKPAPQELVDELNRLIASGGVKNRGGGAVADPVQGGLVREDGRWMYIIRDDIPVMLVEEALALPPGSNT